MARTRGNSDQEAGLRKLLSALGTVRKFANVKYKTVLAPTELFVKVDLPDFPVISIGRRGGFKLPDISTYDGQAGPDALKPPPEGKTPFDACLFGDAHVRKQGSGVANSSPLNNLAWESD
ncbi:MAG: hypothetical protein WCC04_21690 [Terriglobales bacterium]